MKAKFLYFMMAFALVMPFTACDDDNDTTSETGQHDPASDEDQTEITAYDALEWLQSSIVAVDQDGSVIRRIYGEMLDPSDTTILSISVEDYAMAERIFLDWVAPMKEQYLEKVEGGYIYNLTDAYSNSQGRVEFQSADGSEGILAKMNVASGTALKAVSEVRFISKDAWPENASKNQLYKAGEIYKILSPVFRKVAIKSYSRAANYNDNDETPKTRVFKPMPEAKVMQISSFVEVDYYCIQGNDNGEEAILVYLSPDVNDGDAHGRPIEYTRYGAYNYFATVPEAQKVLDYYTKNYEHWGLIIDYMEGLGHKWDWHFGGDTTGNSEFLLNSYDDENGTIKCLDLDSKVGKICDVSINEIWGFRYRYIFVRTAPPYTEE